MRNIRDDIRLVYPPIASGIDSLKAQMSQATYHGMLVLAGLVGLFKLYSDNANSVPLGLVLLMFIIATLSTGISSYHIIRSEQLILERRKIIVDFEREFLTNNICALLERRRSKRSYCKWWCDWAFLVPFLFSLFVGWILVSIYMFWMFWKAEEEGKMDWSQVSGILNGMATPVLVLATIVLAGATIALWRSTSRYAESTEKMAASTERSAEIVLLDLAVKIRDYYNPKSDPSKFHAGFFTIDSIFQKDLDNKFISPNLRLEFEKIGFPLSDNAFVKIRTDSKAWSITDADHEYMIDTNQDKDNLTICISIEEIRQKSELFYGLMLRKWLDNEHKWFSHDDTE